MKNRIILLLTTIISFWFCTAYANFISITPTISFPSQLIIGQQAVAEYQVTNNTGAPLNLTDQSTFSHGFTRLTGAGYCSYNTYLDSGSTCTAAYLYTPQSGDTDFQGQVKQHINGTSITVVVPTKINSQVVQQPVTGMPALTLNKPELVLDPGVQESLGVTNTSAQVTANNVKFNLPTELAAKIDSSTTCATIAPHGSCTLHITAKSDAPTTSSVYTPVQGSNTYPTNIPISIGTPVTGPHLVAYPVTLTDPSVAQNMRLVNDGGAVATVTDVSTSGVSNVNIGSYASCSNIAAGGGECFVPFTADTDAYGSGQIIVKYNATPDATTNLSVANTSLQFLNSDETTLPDNELRVQKGTTQQFLVKNTGNFTWQTPTMNWSGSADITFTAPSSYNPAPGATSAFSLTAGSSAAPEYKGDLTASGNNASTITASGVVTNGTGHALAIEPDVDAGDLHLYYRAIRIDNIDPSSTATITALTTPSITGKVEFCPYDSTTCAYKSGGQCKVGGVLTAGESCLLWYRAIPNETAGLGASTGTISVSVDADWSKNKHTLKETQSREFDIDYEQDLYAAGDFTTYSSSSTAANRIVKWNGGSTWSTLGTGTNDTIRVLKPALGDLFVGGDFTTAGGNSANRIARWNGVTWSALANGVSHTSGGAIVYALDGDETALYAGGYFNNTGGSTLTNIGKWTIADGWSAISSGFFTPTRAVRLVNNRIYAGGEDLIGYYPSTTGSWVLNYFDIEALGINTILAMNNIGNELYVSGTLFDAPSEVPTHPAFADAAAVDSIALAPLPEISFYSEPSINALATNNSSLYVGGNFTRFEPAGEEARHVAEWRDRSEWQRIGAEGLPYNVYALTHFASQLYAGGVQALSIANPDVWDQLQSFDNNVYAMTTAPSLVITASS